MYVITVLWKMLKANIAELGSSSLLFLLLLSFLDNLWSDSVHVSCSLLCEGLTSVLDCSIFALILDSANETSIFQLLKAVSDNLSSSLSVVGWSNSTSLLSTVVRSEGWDTDFTSNVELVGNWSCSSVEPVLVKWGQVLETCSLNVSCPLLNII